MENKNRTATDAVIRVRGLKKDFDQLAVLKGNREFARDAYETALADYKAAELDYTKAQKAKDLIAQLTESLEAMKSL